MNLLILLKRFLKRSSKKYTNKGFTFYEFIFVVSLLSLTSSLVVPLLKNGINKSKQKEASLIVSSLIKSAKANYAINAYLPNNIGELT